MKVQGIGGVVTALGTPLDDRERLHVEGMRRQIETQFDAGVDALLLGSMGAMQTPRGCDLSGHHGRDSKNETSLTVPADDLSVTGLTPEGCRAHQQRRAREIARRDLDAVVVGDARLVHYLPGFWARQVHSRVAAVECDATTRLVMPAPTEQRAGVDEVIGFESDRAGTLVNHPMRVALTTTLERLSHCHRLGGDAIRGRLARPPRQRDSGRRSPTRASAPRECG